MMCGQECDMGNWNGIVCIQECFMFYSSIYRLLPLSLSLSLSVQGVCQWMHQLPAPVTTLELLEYEPQATRGVIVCLRNGEVRLYKDKHLINSFLVDVSLDWLRKRAAIGGNAELCFDVFRIVVG